MSWYVICCNSDAIHWKFDKETSLGSFHVYPWMYTHTYIYIYVSVYISPSLYIYIYYTCTHVCPPMCIHVHLWLVNGMAVPSQCHRSAMAVPRHCHGTSMALPWHCYGTAIWQCHGSAVEVPWQSTHNEITTHNSNYVYTKLPWVAIQKYIPRIPQCSTEVTSRKTISGPLMVGSTTANIVSPPLPSQTGCSSTTRLDMSATACRSPTIGAVCAA